GLLRKAKPNPILAETRIREETGAGDSANADLFDKIAAEIDIVAGVQSCNVRHHVIGPLRNRTDESLPSQNIEQQVAFPFVSGSYIQEIRIRESERVNSGLLKRRRRAYGQKIVDFTNRRCEIGRRDHPTDAPSGHRERLAQAVDQNRTLTHPRQRHNRDVTGSVEHDMFIDLVGNGKGIEFVAEAGDDL